MFQHGIEKQPGHFFIDIKLSHSMISNLIGLTRESTTKNIKILKDKGIIRQEQSKYSIDKEKLENFIGEDGFRELIL